MSDHRFFFNLSTDPQNVRQFVCFHYPAPVTIECRGGEVLERLLVAIAGISVSHLCLSPLFKVSFLQRTTISGKMVNTVAINILWFDKRKIEAAENLTWTDPLEEDDKKKKKPKKTSEDRLPKLTLEEEQELFEWEDED